MNCPLYLRIAIFRFNCTRGNSTAQLSTGTTTRRNGFGFRIDKAYFEYERHSTRIGYIFRSVLLPDFY